MNDNQEVLKKLDAIIKLLAMEKVADQKLVEQVKYLKRAGLADKQIAEILDKPINTITAYTSRLRKGR